MCIKWSIGPAEIFDTQDLAGQLQMSSSDLKDLLKSTEVVQLLRCRKGCLDFGPKRHQNAMKMAVFWLMQHVCLRVFIKKTRRLRLGLIILSPQIATNVVFSHGCQAALRVAFQEKRQVGG